ncbi:MAG: hydrogenase assembly protein HupF [Actinomycetota bacterium]|nr:hydrogenase assembly protein HupF [Actinomycetota bacterium]
MTVTAPDTATGLPAGLPQDLATAALGLARRFAQGATMWCVAPCWPQHASHVAVEFVHPVVVGTRALPALALAEQEATAALRANASAGDVLLLVAPADDPLASDLARRAPAWGVEVLWVGCGAPPAPGAADHVLWLPDEPEAPYDGRLILLYHLLWELTNVCFEHPGLLVEEAACTGPVCITCSDEGRLAEVITADGLTARVRTAAGSEDIDLSLVGAVAPDDLLLVHAGSALTRLVP